MKQSYFSLHHGVFLVVLALLGMCSITAFAAAEPDTIQKLMNEGERALTSRNYVYLESIGHQLERLGKTESNRDVMVVGDALRLHSLISTRDTSDITKDIETLIKVAPELREVHPRAYAVLTRTIAIYYQKILNDNSGALQYALQSLAGFRDNDDKNGEALALSILSGIYLMRNDVSGEPYAVQSYKISKEIKDTLVNYIAACNLASFEFIKDDYDQALSYIDEAQKIVDDKDINSIKSYLKSFRGGVYQKMGDLKNAEKYFKMSVENDEGSSAFDVINSGISYAGFLMEQNRIEPALSLMLKVKEMAKDYKITVFDSEIYFLLSQIYEVMHDYKKSLEYNRLFTEATLNSITEQKEREFAILDLRSRVAEEENKNMLQNIEIVNRNRTIIIISSIAFFVILLCIWLFINSRANSKRYRETVERYLENFRQERNLRQQLETANASLMESRKISSLKEERSDELFKELQRLMGEEKLYHESNITLDKTAAILGTNRTYLSQVVNEKAGKSFTSYINDFRLDEAVEMLSDPENSGSLKEIGFAVGFASPSNFYTLFKQRVGVSPSVFRNNVNAN